MRKSKWAGVVLVCVPGLTFAAGDCERYAENRLMLAQVKTESGGNPFAIGVVGGRLLRQPRNLDEAVATALSLEAQGFNFSVGCRQVNKTNFDRYGLVIQTAFDPARNSKTGTDINRECLDRAIAKFGGGDTATRAALSCYYSGNFTTGQRKEGNHPSYVDKVLSNVEPGNARDSSLAIPVIPDKTKGTKPGSKVSASRPEAIVPKAEKAGTADWDVFQEITTQLN
jgi:type IV secretion system protein VirB1